MPIRVLHGDCLAVMATLEPTSVHAVCTDPPYELNFMGRHWDRSGIAFRPETWAAVLRVMKPGAFMFAFASSRGYHRMVCAIEDAGFVIHPMFAWIFGSGFPKATRFDQPELSGWRYGLQATKPALEPICMAQKPMEKGLTGSQNWEKWGCGGLNIEASRIHSDDAQGGEYTVKRLKPGATLAANGGTWRDPEGSDYHGSTPPGRWPANLCHDGSPEVLAAFAAFGEKTSGSLEPHHNCSDWGYSGSARKQPTLHSTGGNTGSAARFFYTAKADSNDRADSKHPTIKPVSLIKWLAAMICPPGGTILDPFAGSGTTGEAAMLCGFDCTLIEREAEHVRDINHRIRRWSGLDAPLFAEAVA